MFNKRNRKNPTKEKSFNLAEKEEEILEYYDEDELEEYTMEEEDQRKEEDYSEFRDVGVLEEDRKYRRTKRIINIGFAIIMIILIMISIDVISVGRYNKGPFFAIPLNTYKDGGTKEYYGIGYKVIKYHQLQGRRDKVIGTWNLKYDTTATTIQDLDLAIEFTDNEIAAYEKYYKKFVRITSTLKEIKEDKNQLVLGYQDEDGKYSFDIICNVSEDQDSITNFETGKQITVIGTITNYKGKTEKQTNRLYLSDCFAEQ